VIEFTFWPGGLTDPHGQRVRSTWERLLAKLTRPRVAPRKEDVPGLSLATFRGDRRAKANVERVYAVSLDLDEAVDWPALIEIFDATDAFVHTTYSSTPDEVRARAFLRLSRPVDADEYYRCWEAVASKVRGAGIVLDAKPKDPSRFWYLPSIPPGGEYAFSVGRGKPVNVDWCLATVPPPAPPPPPPAPGPASSDVERRAEAYLDRCEPAISGSGGHNATFMVAQRLVRGFELDEATAYRLLSVWNQRCVPPWSDADLRRKLRQASKHGRMTPGELRDRRRAS
jgi:hypothetical protein